MVGREIPGYPRHYDLPRAKIILGFLVQKLQNANRDANQGDFFNNIVKLRKNHNLCCKSEATRLDIESKYSIKNALL